MRIRHSCLAAVSCLWLLLSPVFAGEADEPLPDSVWSFAELVTATLASHPSLQGQRRIVDAAQADLDAARWQRYPVPDLQWSQDDRGNSNVLLALQQPVWTGGRIQAGIRAAEARQGAAGQGVAETQQELLLRVAQLYSEAVRRQGQQRIHSENVAQHEQLLAMIERRVAQNFSPAVDLSLAGSRLAQAASDLSTVNQALDAALWQLTELSGQTVAAVQEHILPEPRVPASLNAAQQSAIAHSPRLAILLHEGAAAEQDARSERARLSPIVALRLEHRDMEVGGSDQRALVVLESQLGAGLSSLSTISAAGARREAVEQRRLTAERELRTEVTLAWQQWRGAQGRVESARQNRDGTQSVYASYARQYAIGQKSWLDLLNSVREDTVAALSIEDAQFESRLARLRLAVLTGHLQAENGWAGGAQSVDFTTRPGN